MEFARFGRMLSILALAALAISFFWHQSGDRESFAGKAFATESREYTRHRAEAAIARVKSDYTRPGAGAEFDHPAGLRTKAQRHRPCQRP